MAKKLKVRVAGKTRTMTKNKVVPAPPGDKKKSMVAVEDPKTGRPKLVKFGHRDYSIAPGTNKGDNYCARSSGISNANDITKPNYWARKSWNCSGKSSGNKRQSQLKTKK